MGLQKIGKDNAESAKTPHRHVAMRQNSQLNDYQ
jgi:hypothetical protein